MKRNGAIIISAIIIAAALIFCGVSITRAVNINNEAKLAASSSETLLMNEAQTAKYLGIEEKAFKRLLAEDSKERQNYSVYPTYKFIPYIMIEGNKYFSKNELIKWVEFNMYNK